MKSFLGCKCLYNLGILLTDLSKFFAQTLSDFSIGFIIFYHLASMLIFLLTYQRGILLFVSKVSALNEAVSGSVKTVFKAWEQRLNSSEVTFSLIPHIHRTRPFFACYMVTYLGKEILLRSSFCLLNL